MNEFEVELMKLEEEFKEVQEAERMKDAKAAAAHGHFQEFIKKHNLPESFALPSMMLLSIRRSRT